MMFTCSDPDELFPDVTDGIPCCMGSAMDGAGRCTCWNPVLDAVPAEPNPRAHPPIVRATVCHDCAFRPGSPERRGVPGFQLNDPDEIQDLIYGDNNFWCHQGAPRIVAWEHPSGATFAAHDAAYFPRQHDGIPYKADGRAQDLCAGLVAARLVARRRA